jgi:hypothetical protein
LGSEGTLERGAGENLAGLAKTGEGATVMMDLTGIMLMILLCSLLFSIICMRRSCEDSCGRVSTRDESTKYR